PDALLVEEVLAAQRADRAEIDDVGGQLVIERIAGEDVNLGMMAAVCDLQLGLAADLAREADAAAAHDAAVGEQRDVGADVRLVGRRELVVDHAALSIAMLEAVVLQHALAGLVAHGTVERMIEQERFQRVGLRLLRLRGNHDDSVVARRRLAGGNDLVLAGHGLLHDDAAIGLALADLDQAHAATGDDGQRGVPAEERNLDAAELGRLDEVQPLVADVNRLVVDVDGGHASGLRYTLTISQIEHVASILVEQRLHFGCEAFR